MPPSFSDIQRGLFFIVGAPRSGTTLLQAILSAHSRLAIPPETEFFMKHVPPASPREWPGYLDRFFASRAWKDQGLDEAAMRARLDATDRSPRSVFLALMSAHAERTGKPRLGEKSPHHCRHVETIRALFPDAKFIHIVRDPRDVVASRLEVPWSAGSYLAVAREWTRIMDDHERLAVALPGDVYTAVRYETLVEQPETEARRLCAFLGEAFEPAMLQFHERAEAGFPEYEAGWKGRTRSPVSRSSVGRYRRALSPRQIAGVQRVVGDRLQRYGYEPESVGGRAWWPLGDALDRLGDHRRRLARSVRKRLGAAPAS